VGFVRLLVCPGLEEVVCRDHHKTICAPQPDGALGMEFSQPGGPMVTLGHSRQHVEVANVRASSMPNLKKNLCPNLFVKIGSNLFKELSWSANLTDLPHKMGATDKNL